MKSLGWDGVAGYRAFAIAPMGEVVRRYDFAAPNDEAALEHAWQYVEYCDVEVWQLHRRVGVLRHTPKVALSARRPTQANNPNEPDGAF
jgi:hypothetical protein